MRVERERKLGVDPKVCECVYGKGVNTRSGPKSVCVCGKGGFLGVYRKVGGLKDVLIRINTSLNPPTFFNYN